MWAAAAWSFCSLPLTRSVWAGVLVVIHDVTEQRKTEELRREFVANVSHELRTPLTNTRSYAETLADNAESSLPTRKRTSWVLFSTNPTV